MKPFTKNQAESILWAYETNADKKRSAEEVIEVRKKRFERLRGFLTPAELLDIEGLKNRALSSLRYHQRQEAEKKKTGKNPDRFKKVEKPEVGMKVHTSWANKGAVFVIIDLEGEFAYLDNPKYKRSQLLKVKITDLHHTAHGGDKISK